MFIGQLLFKVDIIIKFKLSEWQMGFYTVRTIVDIVFYQGYYF